MYRTRSSGQIAYVGSTYTSIGANGQADVDYSVTGSPSGRVQEMTDVVTPNFRSRISQGEIIINPVESLTINVSKSPRVSECVYSPSSNINSSPVFIGDRLTDPIGFYFANLVHPGVVLPEHSAYDLSLVVTDAWSKVASPDAMSLVTALEARETIDFLRQGALVLTKKADPIVKLKDQWVRGKIPVREFRKKLASLWLGYRYGAMPLLYDIQGHLKALSSGVSYQSTREYANATRSTSFSGSLVGPGGSNTLRSYSSEWTYAGTHDYRAGIIYSAGHSRLSDVGLTLADIPASAWEGARLSFVADWAFNVGKYLQGWSGYAKVNCLGAWKSVTSRSTAILTYSESAGKYVGSQVGPLYSSLSQDASGATVSYDFKRVVRSRSDIYDMGLGPTLSLNTKRVVDAFSLLSNALDVQLDDKKSIKGVGRTMLRL